MHNAFKTIVVALSLLLAFTVRAETISPSLEAALNSSHVPMQAVRDALSFRERAAHTRHLFKFYDLSPLDEKPGAFGFVDKLNQAVFSTISETQTLIVFDLNQPSSANRLHIIDLATGAVESIQAAHGSGSECKGQRAGYACTFISDRESRATPLGFFVTGATYPAHDGPAIRLYGLESKSFGFPGNDVASTIIIHTADYVKKGHVGLSWGCPAMNASVFERVKDKLLPGTIFYFYHSSLNFAGRAPLLETEPLN